MKSLFRLLLCMLSMLALVARYIVYVFSVLAGLVFWGASGVLFFCSVPFIAAALAVFVIGRALTACLKPLSF